MQLNQMITFALLLTTPLISQGKLMMNNQSSILNTIKDAHGKEYIIHRNPQPKEKYIVRATFFDAPENLILSSGTADYKSECAVVINKFAGAYTRLIAQIWLDFKKVGKHTYEAELFGDGVLNEDYQQAGELCKWNLTSVNITMKPEPNLSRTLYSAYVTTDPGHLINDGYWRHDGYISKYRFNEPTTGQGYSDSAARKEAYGPIQQQYLSLIRVELWRK